MGRMRVVGLLAAGVLGLAGCGGGDDAGTGGGKLAASASTSAGPSVQEALDAYQTAADPGCVTAPECQDLMSSKLEAAAKLRSAMEAKDPAVYAEPIRLVRTAEERADHYGRDNLGAKGNSYAVSKPLQDMVGWFGSHPGL